MNKDAYAEAREMLKKYIKFDKPSRTDLSSCSCCCASHGGGKARYQDKKGLEVYKDLPQKAITMPSAVILSKRRIGVCMQ